MTCPRCGHSQPEPRTAYSTRCKRCHAHFRLEEALHPAAPAVKAAIATRRVVCFQCGAELEAPVAAASTMCKRCSSHVDLSDYQINQTVSKNFRTHGRLVVEEKGYLLNTDALVGEAVLKGRIIGKIRATRTLEIHSGATIKGTLTGGVLVIPAGHLFCWPGPLTVTSAEIAGELIADIRVETRLVLRSTARFFGQVEGGGLVVEPGAVFVGGARITSGTGAGNRLPAG